MIKMITLLGAVFIFGFSTGGLVSHVTRVGPLIEQLSLSIDNTERSITITKKAIEATEIWKANAEDAIEDVKACHESTVRWAHLATELADKEAACRALQQAAPSPEGQHQ